MYLGTQSRQHMTKHLQGKLFAKMKLITIPSDLIITYVVLLNEDLEGNLRTKARFKP